MNWYRNVYTKFKMNNYEVSRSASAVRAKFFMEVNPSFEEGTDWT